MTKKSNRNRQSVFNYLILPKFQLRYLTFLLTMSTVPILLTVAIISFYLTDNYLLFIKLASLDPETARVLQWELNVMISAIIGSFLMFLALTTAVGIVYSHRVAGVIYKVGKTVREIADGKDTELYLRDGDEFKELQADFNRMLARLKNTSQKQTA